MKYVCWKELNQQDGIRTYRFEIKISRYVEIHAFESGGSVFFNILYMISDKNIFDNWCHWQAVGQSSDGRNVYKQRSGDNFLFFLVALIFRQYKDNIIILKETVAKITLSSSW